MLCDRILYSITARPDRPPRREIAVPFSWFDCRSRAVRKTLPDGKTLRVLLPLGQSVRHGDVLFEDETLRLWADVQPVRLMVADVADAYVLAKLAYELGNLHCPVELDGSRISTLADGPALAAFRSLGLEPTERTARFNPLPLPNGMAFTLADRFTVRRSSIEKK